MKILWLSQLVPYPPKGGVLQRSYNLIREVARYHDITLLAFIQRDLLRSMFPSVEAGLEEARAHLGEFCDEVVFVDILSEKRVWGKVRLAFESLFTRDPYTINWLKSSGVLQTIRSLRDTTNLDLIHFDTISLAPYADLFKDIPKVMDYHNIESHMMLRRADQTRQPALRFYFRLEGNKLEAYEKMHCPEYDLHITCSDIDSDRLRALAPGLHVDTVPNGVDISYFTPRHDNERSNELVFAGGLSWYPNRDAMLYFAREVWPLLRQRVPGVVMNVIGKHPPAELQGLAERDPNFKVHGFVDDVRDYLSAASVYVCPIRDGGGTRLKILDAFAMGLAVVAHPIACEGIEATEDKHVMLASEPQQFVDRIARLLEDDSLRRRLGNSARDLVTTTYAYENIGRLLSSLYEQTIRQHK